MNMADVELVIKIDEDIYKARQHWVANPKRIVDMVDIAIANGIPLPKGHGRLIDERKITKYEQIGLVLKDGNVTRCFITDAPTIIEAE